MGLDVALRLTPRVAMEPEANGLEQPYQWQSAQRPRNYIVIDVEQIEELREIRRFPLAAQIPFRQAEIAAADESSGKIEIVDDHGCGGTRFRTAEEIALPVWQHGLERAAPEPCGEVECKPCGTWQISERQIHRIDGNRNRCSHEPRCSVDSASRIKFAVGHNKIDSGSAASRPFITINHSRGYQPL